jgi:hypothetical protein
MIVVSRSRRRPPRPVKPDNAPSPEEIRRMTAKIRETWTYRELCRRANIVGYLEVSPMPLQPRRKGFWGD